jgi:hypothetical protein
MIYDAYIHPVAHMPAYRRESRFTNPKSSFKMAHIALPDESLRGVVVGIPVAFLVALFVTFRSK